MRKQRDASAHHVTTSDKRDAAAASALTAPVWNMNDKGQLSTTSQFVAEQ